MNSKSSRSRRERLYWAELLERRQLLSETIGPFTITAEPTSATLISNGNNPQHAQLNVVNEPIGFSEALSGPAPIADRGVSFFNFSITHMTFASGALINVPGDDLVLVHGTRDFE